MCSPFLRSSRWVGITDEHGFIYVNIEIVVWIKLVKKVNLIEIFFSKLY